MNHQPEPPQPPINHRTTTQVLTQTATICTTHLFIFLFLSALLFVFRSNVENGAQYLTAFIERDPSLKSLLSRIDISGRSTTHFHHHQNQNLRHHRRRRPFLHLSRVGTLDNDFFSGDEDPYRSSLLGSAPKHRPNGTFLYLNPRSANSDQVVDNGVLIPEIVHPGVSFKVFELPLYSSLDEEQQNETDGGSAEKLEENVSVSESERILDLKFFVKGMDLGHRDATALLFLIGILSSAYGYVILAFLVTYAWVLGIVFVAVVNDLLGKYRSIPGTIWDGSNLGLKRLCGFILMRWAVRDALTQLLGIWFFGEIEDQYSFFKIFVRLKMMPFSIMSSSWVKGYERESARFLMVWFLVDTVVAFIFAVDPWVAIVDTRKSGREVVKEGCNLLWTFWNTAVNIKCLEVLLCGSVARSILSRQFGNLYGLVFQSAMEVFFMAAWLIFYFAARHKDATSDGRAFGRRDLEGFVEGLR